jgi:hypothetical protein
MISRRLARRIGAIVLLLTWSQVATANAVPCAIWCELQGSLAAGELMHAGHDHGQAPPSHDCTASVGASHCGAPQLLVLSAVGHDLLVLPDVADTPADAPAVIPASFSAPPAGFDPPPPRA